MLVYINKENKRKILKNTINTFYKVFTAKFNQEKTEILLIGLSKYKRYIEEKRQIVEQKTPISNKIKIIKNRKTLKILESYIGNKTKKLTQQTQILKKQNLVTVNKILKNIKEKMENQIKLFLQNGKKVTINWKKTI